MIDKKKLTASILMLTTFLLAVPAVPPALASTQANCPASPTACIFVDDAHAGLGQSFSVNVNVLGTLAFVAYDISVQYDTNILQVTSSDQFCQTPPGVCGTLGNTAFDLNHDGSIAD